VTAAIRSAIGACVVLASALFSGGVAPLTASADAPAIAFSTPSVMSPVETVGEPTIVVSPANDATVYGSGPWGSGTQRSIWFASADGGETFRLVQQCAPESGEVSTPCPPPTSVAGAANPPGGGDTDQRLDATGKDYFADLWALACDRVATTTDGGATAKQHAVACTHQTSNPNSVGASDRQWLSVFDPRLLPGSKPTAADAGIAPVTYLSYNCVECVGSGNEFWLKSSDGLNYTPADGGNSHFGGDGYPSVDQVTGDVFQPAGGRLNIGVPDAGGNLTFLDDPGGNALGSSLINYGTGTHPTDIKFAVSSMDTGRNLHITWSAGPGSGAGDKIYTTVASYKTNWTKFAVPVAVSSAPSNSSIFPWVVAGGPGRSDSVWYGTNSTGDPSANSGQEWYTYMAQAVWPVDSDGAVTLDPPLVQQAQVSPHPSHYNSICLSGTGCIVSQGDRNLADFFSVTIDHSGAALVEYNDTTNGLEQAGFSPGDGTADHLGAPVVTIARQDSGLGLYGAPVAPRPGEPTSAPVAGMTHSAGQAKYPVIGGSDIAALDVTGQQLALSADNSKLTVTLNVLDLTGNGLENAFTQVPGSAALQYVTRWIMCPPDSSKEKNDCTIYYAMAEVTPAAAGSTATVQYFGGKAQSIDLCSVSACDPHAIYFPESPSSQLPNATGNPETGSVTCPTGKPCTLSITVNAADVGGPTQSSLLEQVGSYSFASARPQAAVTNAQAEADQLPLQVGGVCCFNFLASAAVPPSVPEVPWAPALVVLGTAAAAGAALRRRGQPGRRQSA